MTVRGAWAHRERKAHYAAIGREVAAEQGRQRAEHKARLAAARDTEAARVKLTRADVEGATAVRTRHGWYPVVRVNKKTVTVRGEQSWHYLVPFAKVLEVQR